MGPLADRRPHQLSGGQQQRVALARALVIEPDAILLDEPLSNLDAKLRIEMRQEIRRIHRETGITTVYVTHDQKEALSMAQRMAVMREGRIEQVGAPRDVYARPRSPFVAEFIGEINFIEGTVADLGPPSVVDTALGRVLASAGPEGLSPGERVLCAVRPEAVSLAGDAADAGAANVLQARVEIQTYLGEVEQYTLRGAGQIEIKAVSLNPREAVAQVGQDVTIRFVPEDVVVLRRQD